MRGFVGALALVATSVGFLLAVPPAAAAAGGGDDAVSCPARLGHVPLSLEEEFAGTPRALANDEGVLVRYTLLCPYDRANGENVAELTLAWSRYAADDLACMTLELTSEPAGDGRIQGALDHPSRSARVTYGAASEAVLPDVERVAGKLLDDVPSDAHPCRGGSDARVDGDIGPPTTQRSSSVALALAAVLLAVTGAAALVVLMLVRRTRRRRVERASEPAPSGLGALAAARRARQQGGDGVRPEGDEPQAQVSAPDRIDASPRVGTGGPGRAEAQGIARGAEQLCRTIEAMLAEAGADAPRQREHAAAVRRLAASARSEVGPSYLSSYAGVMALAAATTNLVSTTARRARALTSTVETPSAAETASLAALLDGLHRRVLVAAEGGLDDGRFWVWQDRRLAVLESLAALERVVPPLVAAQELLTARVGELVAAHARASEEAAWARSVLTDAVPFEGAGA